MVIVPDCLFRFSLIAHFWLASRSISLLLSVNILHVMSSRETLYRVFDAIVNCSFIIGCQSNLKSSQHAKELGNDHNEDCLILADDFNCFPVNDVPKVTKV